MQGRQEGHKAQVNDKARDQGREEEKACLNMRREQSDQHRSSLVDHGRNNPRSNLSNMDRKPSHGQEAGWYVAHVHQQLRSKQGLP